MSECKRIAMWAVPRSLATVLCRAWSNRTDTVVIDEPLLAPYLKEVGYDLGFTRDMLQGSTRETSYKKVIELLLAPLPEGKRILYQKHQPHNLLLHKTGTDFLGQLEHCFLIRRPFETLLSLHKVAPAFTLAETGWPQLGEVFRLVRTHTGRTPLVLDAADLQNDPRQILSQLCAKLGVPFGQEMLSWPALDPNMLSEREKPWYGAAMQSTRIESWRPPTGTLPAALTSMLDACNAVYKELAVHRLRPASCAGAE